MPEGVPIDWDTGLYIDTREGSPPLYHIRSRCKVGLSIPIADRQHTYDRQTLGHVRECPDCADPLAQPPDRPLQG
jgi:hypothetical protein